MSDITLEDIVSLAKRRGFIYQGSDIYGGLAGTWDYGPLGVQLKRNIQNMWWKMFVESRSNMYGIDAAILMNQKVWQASGHAEGFSDPLVVDLKTKKPYRADHLLEENDIDPTGMGLAEMQIAIKDRALKSPEGNQLSDVGSFNMMFSTIVGPSFVTFASDNYDSLTGEVEFRGKGNSTKLVIEERKDVDSLTLYDKGSVSYLRPETAQGMFVNFKNVVDSFYPDLPFGLAQIGKAFRNEISPRDFNFRSREFEQMEIEYFVRPETWEAEFEKLRQDFYTWFDLIGLPKDKVHELDVPAEDRAHYSTKTIDFEFDFPHGKKELYGLAYRTDFDLMNHQTHSSKSMEYRPKDGGAPFVPHCIEPTFGVDRTILAILSAAYTEDELNGEKRVYLKFNKDIAPIKACVSPLLKNKPELVAKAKEVYDMLQKEFGMVTWDDNGNVGKRYRRSDEIGVPAHVTIDFQTLEDNTVTIRNRDTAEQARIAIDGMGKHL